MMLLLLEQGQQEYRQDYIHGRANLKTLILHYEQSALEKTSRIENYYGFENGIDGKELYETGIRQAKNIGIEVKNQEVTSIQMITNGFVVKTQENQYEAKSIILATGNKKNKPQVKNLEEFEGRGISYCAVCDGFFYRNKGIAVIGSGNYAISEVNELINLVGKITILTNGKKLPELRIDTNNKGKDIGIEINTKEIEAVEGDKRIEKVKFKDGTTLKTEGIFVANGVAGSIEFAKKLGIVTRAE